ncbi:hypothetical protein FRC11_014838 [Ceratobasidium sp. 423]|nr:hypothetical protein FRC11_014838 [Ceratobasidium sp. 423]
MAVDHYSPPPDKPLRSDILRGNMIRPAMEQLILEHPGAELVPYKPQAPYDIVEFKLHRDMLSRHLGYFRRYFENHVSLADHDQCPSQVEVVKYDIISHPDDFRKLCQFMYHPSAVASLPDVKAGDTAAWRSTVEATIEFDMPAARSYVVSRLAQDERVFSFRRVSFLRWSMGLDQDQEGLMRKCYRLFALRRKPPTPSEIEALPKEVVPIIVLIRERVRNLFLDRKTLLAYMTASGECTNNPTCSETLIDKTMNNMANPSFGLMGYASILDPLDTDYVCGACRVPNLIDMLKERLGLQVDLYFEGLDVEPMFIRDW